MRILYDGSCFSQAYGGVSRYYCEMIRRLPHEVEAILPLKETVNRYLQEAPFNISPMYFSVHNFVQKYLGGWYMPGVSHLHRILSVLSPDFFSSGEMLNMRHLSRLIQKNKFDIYHVTGPNHYNSAWHNVKGKKPIVVTVHDLIFDKIIADKRVVRGRRDLLNAADAVIAVSMFTKREIIEFYKIPEEKIFVVYHGQTFPVARTQRDGGYILYVGARQGYKNWDWFVCAIASLMKELDLNLVCTGGSFTAKELALLTKLGIRDRVTAKFVSDDEMQTLYSNATAFVYPSKSEGFGLPILDAWSLGCPVVLSRASCFPEIARDAAAYFDLGDEDGLCDAIRSVCGSQRARYAERGYAEVCRFSWDNCAVETMKVYESVV